MAKRTSSRKAPAIVEYAQNRWRGCVAPGDAALDRLDAALGRPLPPDVRDLLATCAGGAPERSFFMSPEHGIEVAIGHVLHVAPPRNEARTVESVLSAIAADGKRSGASDEDLVPFAVDNGNAHFLCVDRSGRVVYRVLHEPEGTERRVVADSLGELLDGLEEPPF